jgi:hypothetical protein
MSKEEAIKDGEIKVITDDPKPSNVVVETKLPIPFGQ